MVICHLTNESIGKNHGVTGHRINNNCGTEYILILLLVMKESSNTIFLVMRQVTIAVIRNLQPCHTYHQYMLTTSTTRSNCRRHLFIGRNLEHTKHPIMHSHRRLFQMGKRRTLYRISIMISNLLKTLKCTLFLQLNQNKDNHQV